MKRVCFVLMTALALAAAPAASAQQAQGGGSGSGQGSGQGQGRGNTVTAAYQGTSVPMINVRLDLMITDQTTSNATPIKKAMSLLLVERGSGRVRSQGFVEPTGASPFVRSYNVTLNADATVARIEGDRIRIGVTVEYAPAAPEGTSAGARGSQLNQTVEVVLVSGKPTVIVQSSDPLTDRKVTLEATATIIR